MSRSIVKYSEALKMQVVNELEDGKLCSIGEARERYGITGAATVSSWLRKYGRKHLLPRIIRVEKPEERDEKKP